jgi:hypothetical protein
VPYIRAFAPTRHSMDGLCYPRRTSPAVAPGYEDLGSRGQGEPASGWRCSHCAGSTALSGRCLLEYIIEAPWLWPCDRSRCGRAAVTCGPRGGGISSRILWGPPCNRAWCKCAGVPRPYGAASAPYRVTSLIRNSLPLGPFGRPLRGALWWS